MASSLYEYQSAIVAEKFHSLDYLGCGPHGRVYRAYDEKMDSVIAVKRLEISSFVPEEQLKREILDIKRMRHRNIIPIYYALVRPEMTLLVSPIKQCNLLALIPMPYEIKDKTSNFYSLTIQMLSALTYLQEEGISHRNIKPTNILVQATERGYGFYLTDFALAYPETRRIDYIYRAPETHTGIYPVTCKQDVWSLFVTLAVTCGRISELEIRCRSPLEILQILMDTGFLMPELEDMSRYNPTQRASASVMFHRLRPKEKLNYYGGVDYPDVSTEYFGLYGSGRLETEQMVPIGPNADLRALEGPLGLSPLSVILRPSGSVRLAQPLPAIIFDHGMYDQNVPPSAELRETSASPLSEYPQSPPEVPEEDEQFQPEPHIEHEGQMERLEYGGQMDHLEHDRQMERLEHERRQMEQNLLSYSCCTIPQLYNVPADNNVPLPPLSSIIPRPVRAYVPCTCLSDYRYSATTQVTFQRSFSSQVTNNWGNFEYGPAYNGNPTVRFNGVGFMVQPQGLAYVRPYPIPCDCPTEPSEPFEFL
ncbi:kinase-like domain-containing protein [Trichoderma evansii]